jgi:hypothetical protein
MIGTRLKSRWLLSAVILTMAECAVVVVLNAPFVDSAQAQFFRDDRPRVRPQRSGGFFDGLFGPSPRRDTFESEPEYRPSYQGGGGSGGGGGGDNSRAPSPRKAEKGEAPPTTSIVVMGDSMADWLAYGLEEAFGDAPEIGIIRKNKPRSGLLRYDVKNDLDWWHAARDLLAAEKPSYVVMMLGVSDRDSISARDLAREAAKEAAKKEAEKKEADKKEADKKKAGEQPAAAADKTQPDKPDAAKPADKTAQTAVPDKEGEDAEQSGIIAPEPSKKGSGTIEFRTERWAEVYSKRIDDTVAALKSKGVPVFWVGLPSVKGTRSTADAVYLNDLYRSRAQKAGAIYIDVWDGFVDEGGKFTNNGPDFEGQVRRLRSADGVYFTKYGARKLAHYVERELRRYMSNRSLVSLPSGPVGPVPAEGKSEVRPLAGPVVPLTVTPGNSDELLGGAGNASARGDAIATQVLVKGEPVAAPAGRADDFAWRQSGEAAAPQPAAVTNVTPASAPAASAYTEPAVETKKPAESKSAPATSKLGQFNPSRKTENSRPRPAHSPAPQRQRQPQAAQSSGPFGGLFR